MKAPFDKILSQPLPLGVREEILAAKKDYDRMKELLEKIVGPYVWEDDINCLDDVMILARNLLDDIDRPY